MSTAGDVVHHADVVFSSVPGYRPLALDLYLGEAPEVACIYLHGGGWRRGSRRDGPGHRTGHGHDSFRRMAGRGLAVLACDYRLSGEALYPAQLDDVVAACRSAGEILGRYDMGDLPLTLWGLSAGGHLAALAALASPVADLISAATCWSAPSDLPALPDDLEAAGGEVDRGPTSREALLLGRPADDVPELAHQASPAHRVRPTTTPIQLVHGTADVHVPFAQSERFAAALRAAPAPVTLVPAEGADHFYSIIDHGRLTRLVDGSIDFLLSCRATGPVGRAATT